MADTDSESLDDKSEVQIELSDLETDFENLLKNSQILVAHYSDIKKKNAELVLQLSEKNKIIEKQSNKISELSEESNKLSDLLKAKSDSLQPSDEVLALRQKVEELTSDLAKFVNGTKNLNLMLGTSRFSSDKSGLGYQKVEKHITKIKLHSQCTICKKQGHKADRCFFRKMRSKTSKANPKGPKKIWVPKSLIIPLADVLNRKKKTPPMVSGQWLLTSHDGRKVYVPRPSAT